MPDLGHLEPSDFYAQASEWWLAYVRTWEPDLVIRLGLLLENTALKGRLEGLEAAVRAQEKRLGGVE